MPGGRRRVGDGGTAEWTQVGGRGLSNRDILSRPLEGQADRQIVFLATRETDRKTDRFCSVFSRNSRQTDFLALFSKDGCTDG